MVSSKHGPYRSGIGRWLVCMGLVISVSSVSAYAQVDIDVYPFSHKQKFYAGGCGVSLYSGHLVNGLSDTNREMAYDWLFTDLDNEYIRFSAKDDSEPVNDDNDPTTLNLPAFSFNRVDAAAPIFQAAILRNPNTKVMMLAQNVPQWLRRPKASDPTKQELDYGNPDLYDEIAEWMYAHLVALKNDHGLDCEIIDIANEPDLGSKTFPYGQQGVQDVLENVVPKLQALIDNGTHGVQMPQIMAPSCVGTGAAKNYLTNYKNNAPAAWNNIDVVSTHMYGAPYNADNIKGIDNIRGGRLFIQSEMHPGHKSVKNKPEHLPDDSLEDAHESAVIMGRLLSTAANNGVNAWSYFLANAPNSGSATSLIRTPWGGTPERRKSYWVFKQMTTLQPYQSAVTGADAFWPNGTPVDPKNDGIHVLPMHKWGILYSTVNVTNATMNDELIDIELLNNDGAPMGIERVIEYVSNETQDMVEVADDAYATPITGYAGIAGKNAVHTFLVYYRNWTEIMYDDFENGWGNYVDGGNDCSLYTNTTHAPQGTSAANIQDNSGANSSFETAVGFDLSTYDKLLVSFSFKAVSMENNEDFLLELDDGSGNYEVIGNWVKGTDFSNNEVDTIHVIVSPADVTFPFGTSHKLRFRCDASGNGDDVYVDEIKVSGL